MSKVESIVLNSRAKMAKYKAWLSETALRVEAKHTPIGGPVFGGRCQACDNGLPEQPAHGAVSGKELGLCNKCAYIVNNEFQSYELLQESN